MQQHAAYRVDGMVDGDLHIIDMSDSAGTMSVTNAAEYVTYELYLQYGNLRFYYLDTQREWAELVHAHGIFLHFAPVSF